MPPHDPGHPHSHSHDHDPPAPGRWPGLSRPGGPPRRSLRVGIGGPVGSGKTELVSCLCRAFADELGLAVVTNDIFTREDAAILERKGVLPTERIMAVQTGCCPHTAIRDDISENLDTVEQLEARFDPDLVLVESGGDNLTATFSYALVDVQIFVIDVSGGDKVPRKGGPGITRSDLLVVNKTDLAELVGADLGVMARDAEAGRGGRPTAFVSLRMDQQAEPVAAWIRGLLADRAAALAAASNGAGAGAGVATATGA